MSGTSVWHAENIGPGWCPGLRLTQEAVGRLAQFYFSEPLKVAVTQSTEEARGRGLVLPGGGGFMFLRRMYWKVDNEWRDLTHTEYQHRSVFPHAHFTL